MFLVVSKQEGSNKLVSAYLTMNPNTNLHYMQLFPSNLWHVTQKHLGVKNSYFRRNLWRAYKQVNEC
jgi:trehalose-6-phosphate synthase